MMTSLRSGRLHTLQKKKTCPKRAVLMGSGASMLMQK